MRASPIYAVLALTLAPNLVAQQAPLLAPGQRIRVSSHGHQAVGTFVMVRGDTLTTRSSRDATVNYPLSEVAQIERSRGRRQHSLAGAGIGILVGAGFGFWVAPIGPGWQWAAVFAVPGLFLGGIVGVFIVTERWQDVPLDRLRVGIVPRGNGVGLGASLRF